MSWKSWRIASSYRSIQLLRNLWATCSKAWIAKISFLRADLQNRWVLHWSWPDLHGNCCSLCPQTNQPIARSQWNWTKELQWRRMSELPPNSYPSRQIGTPASRLSSRQQTIHKSSWTVRSRGCSTTKIGSQHPDNRVQCPRATPWKISGKLGQPRA